MTSSWFSKLISGSPSLEHLPDLWIAQMCDLYDAEIQLIAALPKMAAAANSPHLKEAFRVHLEETKNHQARLEQAFQLLGIKPTRESCEAMQGLISEGEEMIAAHGDPQIKDAALIAAAQRVEHYEIAGYGCARSFARRLGQQSIADLLGWTLK
jgi:ferritin-like metal-binding protein YciE